MCAHFLNSSLISRQAVYFQRLELQRLSFSTLTIMRVVIQEVPLESSVILYSVWPDYTITHTAVPIFYPDKNETLLNFDL